MPRLPGSRPIAAVLLVALGLLNVVGHTLGWSGLSAIALLTAASPLPLVFTDRGEYEDFATTYRLEIRCPSHGNHRVEVDKQHFARLAGPFDRRGAFSSAFIYAPLLEEDLFQAIARKGFCSDDAPLLGLLVPEHARSGEPISGFTLTVGSKTHGRELVRFGKILRCPPRPVRLRKALRRRR